MYLRMGLLQELGSDIDQAPTMSGLDKDWDLTRVRLCQRSSSNDDLAPSRIGLLQEIDRL